MTKILSYIVPVYNPNISDICELVRSFNSQNNDKFEVIFADDGSTNFELWNSKIVEYANFDFHIVRNKVNLGISSALNLALENVKTKYAALVDQDDCLVSECTNIIMQYVEKYPREPWFYTDEFISFNPNENYVNIQKNAFNKIELHSNMYLNHLEIFNLDILGKHIHFDSKYDGSQDHELAIRLVEKGFEPFHINRSVYIWNRTRDSFSSGEKKNEISRKCVEHSLLALNQHVAARFPLQCRFVNIGLTGMYKLEFDENFIEQISVIIPTGARTLPKRRKLLVEQLLESMIATIDKSLFQNYEFILIASDEVAKIKLQKRIIKLNINVKIIVEEGPFNFSKKVNSGLQNSSFNKILLLNDDIRFISKNIPQNLLNYLYVYDLDLVGPLILSIDGRIQSAGDRIGSDSAHHIGTGLSPYFGLGNRISQLSREVSSLTGACLLFDKSTAIKSNLFDERFPSAYQDVVFCSQIKRRSGKIAVIPHNKVAHWEGLTRGKEVLPKEWNLLKTEIATELSAPDPLGFPLYIPGTLRNDSIYKIIKLVIARLGKIRKFLAMKLRENIYHNYRYIIDRIKHD